MKKLVLLMVVVLAAVAIALLNTPSATIRSVAVQALAQEEEPREATPPDEVEPREPGEEPREWHRGPRHPEERRFPQREPRRPWMEPLTEEQLQELIAFLEEFDPERAARLKELLQDNPEGACRIAVPTYRQMQELLELKEEDPEAFQDLMKRRRLERKVWELVEKYKRTRKEQKKKEIKDELRTVLSELFDLREKDRERQIEELEEELKRLKDLLARRRKKKELIVENHLKDLLGENEDMKW
jgi:hypothetical protein